MNKFLLPLAFGLFLPTAALAQINPDVAAQCKDARDFMDASGPLRLLHSPELSGHRLGV